MFSVNLTTNNSTTVTASFWKKSYPVSKQIPSDYVCMLHVNCAPMLPQWCACIFLNGSFIFIIVNLAKVNSIIDTPAKFINIGLNRQQLLQKSIYNNDSWQQIHGNYLLVVMINGLLSVASAKSYYCSFISLWLIQFRIFSSHFLCPENGKFMMNGRNGIT